MREVPQPTQGGPLVDATLLPAIRAAIKANEIGTESPYRLSYARLGVSGASFGIFQGDTNVNHEARATCSKRCSRTVLMRRHAIESSRR